MVGIDMSPRKSPELPRQTIWMDDKGRIVVPDYMRKALGLKVPGWILIERYPLDGECTTIFIKPEKFQ